ncbi:MAG: GspH/FimT family pseudopilin [Patescibacteria group bacterium]|jgi:Tfp pilus assembly protein FimT
MKYGNFFSSRRRAFTVYEILIVIGIIVLLSAITIPYINKFQPNLKLNAAARGLTADLRYAQQLTITEQVLHLVSLDIASGSYSLLRVDAATTTVKSVDLPLSVSFNAASTTVSQVRFNSYGGVVSGSVGQIFLTNTNSKNQLINIKPSGYVELSN